MGLNFKTLLPIYCFCCLFTATAQNKRDVVAGPMMGQVELRSGQVWIELKEGIPAALIRYWQKGKTRATGKTITVQKLDAGFPNVYKFDITGLEPATTYEYQVGATRAPEVLGAGIFTTQDLWQWRKAPPDFSFLTGSCAYFNEPQYDRPGKPYGGDSTIFLSMARERSAFMLWLGDNWYTREADYYSAWGLNYRASRDRSMAVLQPFLKAMPHYAIWDDHDYGPNDADKSYVLKQESRKVFMNSWCNPSFGENGEGVYSRFTYNDVDFFLLDDRWFRSHDATPDSINGQPNTGKRMFGQQQMEWFKNAMRLSNGNTNINFRIIAIGSQVLNPLSPFDCFRHFSAEYREMLDFLQTEKINGVVFLTGDRHLSEINKLTRDRNYPLYDITSSPLTSGTSKYSEAERNNPARVLSITDKQNYTRVSFSGKGQERRMLAEFLDINGDRLGEWSVNLKDVSNK
ncbi:hypothetical protein EXU57_11390 [Segetibacter sp. 3557_3]|uniref:alkaline phosphatase D family protein n=1 Tax=Segetibacter sp. 3557_3 TaxID=2547429 RepID=UPI00105897B8|nr:alkaline phosphatase D family protein [Segetibacter sp. 3557_3]TDH26095.1 hypothetical protein EXU57_11390 [Segetibacter sp. 3557_3]